MNNCIHQYSSRVAQLIQDELSKNSLLTPRTYHEHVLQGGQKLRASITLCFIDTLKKKYPTKWNQHHQTWKNASLIVEYIHTASLIIDDLPHMDNETERRQRPCLHHKYNTSIAHLVSYNLILAAHTHLTNLFETFELPYNKYRTMYHELHHLFSNKLNLSHGLCAGQYLDLNFDKECVGLTQRQCKEKMLDLIRQKTGSLFSLSFLLGWVVMTQDSKGMDEINSMGESFGILYQILDDLRDYQDDKLQQKTKNTSTNIFDHFTIGEVIHLFNEHCKHCTTIINNKSLSKLSLLPALLHYIRKEFLNTLQNYNIVHTSVK